MSITAEIPSNIAQVIAHHSKSFHLASRLLAPQTRRRVQQLYAWCRFVDDSIDRAEHADEAHRALDFWRDSLDSIYNDRDPQHPLLLSIAEVIRSCDLPRLYFEELLAGMEMDVVGLYGPEEQELLLYCHRVAGVVGLLMTHVMGVRDDCALSHAAHLGIGMQLINIARDIAEDWQLGRLYVPRSWLAEMPVPGQSLCEETFRPAVQRLLSQADAHLEFGRAGLGYLDLRSRIAVSVAADVYGAIGQVIRQRNYAIQAGRAVVSWPNKLLHAARAITRAITIRPQGTGPIRRPQQVWTYSSLCETHFPGRE
jgi:phytoene synthase